MADHPVRVAWAAGAHPGIAQAEEEYFVYAANAVTDITTRNLERVRWVVLKTDAGPLLYRADDTSTDPEDGINVILDSEDRPFVLDSAAPLGLAHGNILINGGMEVSQENGASLLTSSGQYAADQWSAYWASWATGAFSAQQVTDAPAGYGNSVKLTVTAAEASPGASAQLIFHTLVEGYRSRKLALGTASSRPFVVGFWVKSSVTGSFGVTVKNYGQNQTYVGSITVAQANTWEWKTVAVPARTVGTWLTGTACGLRLMICAASGANGKAAPGWYAANYLGPTGMANLAATLGATFQMTGAVLLPGGIVPLAAQAPALMRPLGEELLLCWRYYCAFYAAGGAWDAFGMGQAYSSTGGVFIVNAPTEFRVAPTLSFSAANTFSMTNGNDANLGAATAIAANVIGNKTFRAALTVASGATAGQGSTLFRNSTAAAFIRADARLY